MAARLYLCIALRYIELHTERDALYFHAAGMQPSWFEYSLRSHYFEAI